MRLQALQRGIERAVFHQQRFFRCLLNGSRDALSVLRTKNKCAKDEQVQRALQQLEPFSGFLGRHITCVSDIWVRCQPNDWRPTIGEHRHCAERVRMESKQVQRLRG